MYLLPVNASIEKGRSPCSLCTNQLETLIFFNIGLFKFPFLQAKMVFKWLISLSYSTKEQLSSTLVVLIKLVYTYANICFVTLYMMVLFLRDLNIILILKLLIKSNLKIKLSCTVSLRKYKLL